MTEADQPSGDVTSVTEKAMQVLEFDKVKAQIQAYAACSLGKERIAVMAPLPNADAAVAELAAVDEALQVLYRYGSLPYGGITDVRPLLRKAAIGGVLAGTDLISIADFIAGGRRVRQTLQAHAEHLELPHLMERAEGLFDARQTEQEIRLRVADDGTLHDDASSALRKLRNEKRTWEARVRQVLEQTLRSHQKYLQDPVITMRGSSLCLPVRIEYKNQVPGIVHDVSSSGATVFIEPQGAVEAGLRARELGLEEEREIERILQQVSGVVAEVADALITNAEILGQLDAWFAKASYAKEEGCERPGLRRDGVWRLVRARHPLLPKDSAVPMDVTLGDAYRMIIITGPNTGGKTVALKTVGLLTVMA
ncbi:MAG: endonuclease MutS2, partial [Alicyclobacillus sp.]|nr:endonuclease MutS2 [Alicyclobacillus sp.]